MSDISVSFSNNYSDSRRWVIWDLGRDQNSPPVVFDGYLDPNQSTDALPFYSSDGIFGQAVYQRSDGSPTKADVQDGSNVRME